MVAEANQLIRPKEHPMTTTAPAPRTTDLLPAALGMGMLTLKVGDLAKMTDYYRTALGLAVLSDDSTGVVLGRINEPLLRLEDRHGLILPGRGEAGLFHTALLFEDQAALAAVVATAAQHPESRFAGSADHLVSEAFYFTDPEGNGIELYWDRPRDQWIWHGTTVEMDSLALNPNDYLRKHLTEQRTGSLDAAAAEIGHVHLQVGDTSVARDFYVDTLGFAETASMHGQALFVSAGGYHHHMAMNVWNSRGAGPRKDTLGLGEVLIRVPGTDDVTAVADRLRFAGIENHHDGSELRFEDPWRNRLRIAVG